jgi:hypothetical protein
LEKNFSPLCVVRGAAFEIIIHIAEPSNDWSVLIRLFEMQILHWDMLELTTVSIFRPEDGDRMFLRNVNIYLRVYTATKSRRTSPSY